MIGVFDSGIGGLTVVKELFRLLPEYQILYFGDTARTPYGTKSEKTIKKYAFQDTEFLLEKGAKIIIVACNTASAVAAEDLRKKYQIPIFEVITPAVEKSLQLTKNKRIGIIGTQATIKSGIYEKLIKKSDNQAVVFPKACPLFVPLVEENWMKKPETKSITKKYLQSLKLKNIDTLILGCTHHPLLKEVIQAKIGKRRSLVDPGQETVLAVQQFLKSHPEIESNLLKGDDHKFYLSDLTTKFQDIAHRWLEKKIKLQLVEVE